MLLNFYRYDCIIILILHYEWSDIMNPQDNLLDANNLLHLNKYTGKTFVIKYGGSIMDNQTAQHDFFQDVLTLSNLGINIVIVHGGGPEISMWLNKVGITSKFIKGLRITDAPTMEIVEMVLSGHVNKNLSLSLSKIGANAIGISGKDSNLIKAKKKYIYEKDEKIDLGFVGEVVNINDTVLLSLIEKNYIPVVSPIGCDLDGNSYNINADYAAASISGALKADKLIIMTDIEGVYTDINDSSTLLSSITAAEIKKLISTGIINGGMIPKLECCTNALEKGAKNVHLLDGRKNHSLLHGITTNCGTKII